VRIVPLASYSAAPGMPPPYGRPPARIATAPDGYGPSSRIVPPDVDDALVNGAASLPMPHASPPRPAVQAGHPPLPRPRPKMAATAGSPAAESTASASGAVTPSVAPTPSSFEPAELVRRSLPASGSGMAARKMKAPRIPGRPLRSRRLRAQPAAPYHYAAALASTTFG